MSVSLRPVWFGLSQSTLRARSEQKLRPGGGSFAAEKNLPLKFNSGTAGRGNGCPRATCQGVWERGGVKLSQGRGEAQWRQQPAESGMPLW